MTLQNTANPLRVGILALPLSGLLFVVSTLMQASAPNLRNDPTAAVLSATMSGYLWGNFLFLIGLILAVFGTFSLFAYLYLSTDGRRVGAWASAAIFTSIIGITLVLPIVGIETFSIPAMGQMYISWGQNDDALARALEAEDAFFSSSAVLTSTLAALLYSAGTILFGVALWRRGTLPKWAAVCYALSGPLLSLPIFGVWLSVLGALLTVIGGGGIALSVWQGSSAVPTTSEEVIEGA